MTVPTEQLTRSQAEWDEPVPTEAEERWESIKAALFAAMAVGLTFAMLTAFNRLMATAIPSLWVLQMQGLNVQGLGSGAVALMAGCVFGINYRYAVRTDMNPHLGSGVVMAFGSVRGLTQLDVGLMSQGVIWPFIVLALESFFLFAIARLLLDLVLRLGWVRRSLPEESQT